MLDSNVRVKKTCRGHVFSGRGLMNFSNRTEPIRRAGRHRRMNVSILLHCKPKRECRTGIDEPFQSHWTCQVMQKLTHSRAIVFFFKTEILTQHGRIYSFIFLFTKLLSDEPQTHNPKVVGSNPSPATKSDSVIDTIVLITESFFMPWKRLGE